MITTKSLSVSETAALLEEVAASVASEVPLTASLATLEGREAGRIGAVASKIRHAIESGESVERAISENLHHESDSIAVALRIGHQTGEAARSLRTLAKLMIMRRELRLRQLAASVYPVLVMVLGYLVGVFVFGSLVSLESEFLEWPKWVAQIGLWLQEYWWIPPVVVCAALLAVRFSGLSKFLPHGLQPGRWSSQAIFCDAVAWQIESGVCLPDAIRAAAAMAGEKALGADADAWAKSLEQGRVQPDQFHSFRPLVVWTLNTDSDGNTARNPISLSMALQRLADSYRKSEQHAWMVWTHWVPIVSASLIGGVLSISYLCAVVWPLYSKLAEIN